MAITSLQKQSAQRQAAFQALRPVTTKLLQLRTQPAQLQAQLRALQSLLAELPPEGLQGCWDYVLLPLTLLMDSVGPSRQKQQPQAAVAGLEAMAPACQSDRVVEALLGGWGRWRNGERGVGAGRAEML
jgi:hypothetical protein